MRNRAYCPYCRQEVELVYPKMNIPIYIVVGILTIGWGLILYPILFYGLANKTRCHKCGAKIARWIDRKPLFTENN